MSLFYPVHHDRAGQLSHYGRAAAIVPTGRADVLGGMSQLPDGCGVAVRLLGAHVENCAGRICSMFGQEVRPRMHTRTFDFESQPSTIGGTQCPS